MSIIEYTIFPKTDFDIDLSSIPEVDYSLLDLFDIFDPLDFSRIANQLDWIERPSWLSELEPRIGQVERPKTRKYRIAVDIRGLNKQSVKTTFSDDKKKLIVTAKEGEIKSRDVENYTLRELKRTYKLPSNLELEKLASYMAPSGKLMIEIPFASPQKEEKEAEKQKKLDEQKNKDEQQQQQQQQKQAAKKQEPVQQKPIETQEQKQPQKKEEQQQKEEEAPKVMTDVESLEDIVPRIVNGNSVEMRIDLPEIVAASKIKVTCKDQDVIITVRDEQNEADTLSEMVYYRRIQLPNNTDFTALKCKLDGKQLTVCGPLISESKGEGKEGSKLIGAQQASKVTSPSERTVA